METRKAGESFLDSDEPASRIHPSRTFFLPSKLLQIPLI